MKTVIFDIRSPGDAMADIAAALKSGKARKSARIFFATPEVFWKVIAAKRWELLIRAV